jgi:hypothetical protein
MNKKIREYEVSMQLVVNPSRDIDKAEPELMKVKCIVQAESEEEAKYIARRDHNDGYSVWLTWAHLIDTPESTKVSKQELQSVLDELILHKRQEGRMDYDSNGKLRLIDGTPEACYVTRELLTEWINDYGNQYETYYLIRCDDPNRPNTILPDKHFELDDVRGLKNYLEFCNTHKLNYDLLIEEFDTDNQEVTDNFYLINNNHLNN